MRTTRTKLVLAAIAAATSKVTPPAGAQSQFFKVKFGGVTSL